MADTPKQQSLHDVLHMISLDVKEQPNAADVFYHVGDSISLNAITRLRFPCMSVCQHAGNPNLLFAIVNGVLPNEEWDKAHEACRALWFYHLGIAKKHHVMVHICGATVCGDGVRVKYVMLLARAEHGLIPLCVTDRAFVEYKSGFPAEESILTCHDEGSTQTQMEKPATDSILDAVYSALGVKP